MIYGFLDKIRFFFGVKLYVLKNIPSREIEDILIEKHFSALHIKQYMYTCLFWPPSVAASIAVLCHPFGKQRSLSPTTVAPRLLLHLEVVYQSNFCPLEAQDLNSERIKHIIQDN